MKVTFETMKFSKILGGICQNVLVVRILIPNDDVEIMNFSKKITETRITFTRLLSSVQ